MNQANPVHRQPDWLRHVLRSIVVLTACSMAACWSRSVSDVSTIAPYSSVVGGRYAVQDDVAAYGTVFVADKAIRRADWFTEQIDYIGHFERPVLDDRLEIRVQVIRWNDRDSFEPPTKILRPLIRAR